MIDVYSSSGLALFITRDQDRLRTHPTQEPSFLLTYRFACRLNFRHRRLLPTKRLAQLGLTGVQLSNYQQFVTNFVLARFILSLPPIPNLIRL